MQLIFSESATADDILEVTNFKSPCLVCPYQEFQSVVVCNISSHSVFCDELVSPSQSPYWRASPCRGFSTSIHGCPNSYCPFSVSASSERAIQW